MALHPLSQGFAGVAGAYDRGRPAYTPAIVGEITRLLELAPGDPVLDLAAGTGKLARALQGAGFDVVAVEPQRALREILASGVGPGRVREGVAEEIPLEDDSVAAVTVADAFHWFDPIAALAEIRRVLRPGGALAVIRSAPNWGSASWAHEVGALVASLRPEHPQFDGLSWQEAVLRDGGWSEPREVRLTMSQPMTPERLSDYVESISWIAALPDDRRAELLDEVGAIVAAGETPPEMDVGVLIGVTAPSAGGGQCGDGDTAEMPRSKR